jgi:hypothetical protein
MTAPRLVASVLLAALLSATAPAQTADVTVTLVRWPYT